MPEQVLTGRAVAFDPATHGFAFPNAFVNVVLTLPNGARITTAGRCGGMAYAALDYFLRRASRCPRWRSDLWTPSRVPPDSHWLAQLFTQRLRDSFFTGSAAKFVTWSMHSDDATWVFKGVTRWTKEEELPRRHRVDRRAAGPWSSGSSSPAASARSATTTRSSRTATSRTARPAGRP